MLVPNATAASRFLHLNINRGTLSVATPGQTHGHAATSSIFSFGVAATPAAGPFPSPFSTANAIETFSSDGPRKVFYLGNGAQLTPGDVSSTGGFLLLKPDITAADGVSVSGAGRFPGQFFGPSAAGPHPPAIKARKK